jgi:iron complex transport system substrate-binding protein
MRGENIVINKIAKIASITLVLIMAFTLAIGCKTVEPEEEAAVETEEEAVVEDTEEEVTEEEVEEEAVAEEPETITITDSAGREVTINKPVEKIVIGHVVDSEAVRLLGAWDRAVGRDMYTVDEVLFPGASKLPAISGMQHIDINYEKVFELQPDIFLNMYYPMFGFDDVVANLEPEISVVFLNFEDPTTLVDNIRKLGLILDKEEEAEEYIAFYEGVVSGIREKVAGFSEEEKPQVLMWPFNFDYTEKYMVYAGDIAGIQAQIDIVGGINIAEDMTGWFPYVDAEWLAEQDIDVIVGHVSPMVVPDIFGYEVDDSAVAQNTIDWVMNGDENPVLSGSDAIKNERVYLYQNELAGSRAVCRPGPTGNSSGIPDQIYANRLRPWRTWCAILSRTVVRGKLQ